MGVTGGMGFLADKEQKRYFYHVAAVLFLVSVFARSPVFILQDINGAF